MNVWIYNMIWYIIHYGAVWISRSDSIRFDQFATQNMIINVELYCIYPMAWLCLFMTMILWVLYTYHIYMTWHDMITGESIPIPIITDHEVMKQSISLWYDIRILKSIKADELRVDIWYYIYIFVYVERGQHARSSLWVNDLWYTLYCILHVYSIYNNDRFRSRGVENISYI